MNLKPKFFDKKTISHRISHEEEHAAFLVGKHLGQLIPKSLEQPLVIVCIGSDRSTGDSLGPLIGWKLSEKKLSHFHVYGTIHEPIHAVNLEKKLHMIYENHKNPFVIAVDACLGKLKSVGTIILSEGPLRPGAGVNKQLPPVGEAHVTGIVNVSGFMEYMVLQNTRLGFVMNLADVITKGFVHADINLKHHFAKQEQQSSLNINIQ